MPKKKKQKVKTKIVYRDKTPILDTSKTKEELSKLQERRVEIGKEVEKSKEGKKGFAKFAAGLGGLAKKGAINKAISQKKRVLGTEAARVRVRQQTEILKERTQLEKARAEFRETRDKGKVDFDPFKTSEKKSKGIHIDDLY